MLHLPAPLRDAIARHARAAHPLEACGLLLGHRPASGPARVTEVTSARNLAASPTRYLLDPVHLLEAERRAEGEGRAVLGAWHSHPGRPATPSPHDHAAAWASWIHVIVSVTEERIDELRAWRLGGPAPVELDLLPRAGTVPGT